MKELFQGGKARAHRESTLFPFLALEAVVSLRYDSGARRVIALSWATATLPFLWLLCRYVRQRRDFQQIGRAGRGRSRSWFLNLRFHLSSMYLQEIASSFWSDT